MPSITRMLEREREREITYIATSEITSLKHEVGDHTMELGALVSETFLASAKGAKVLYRFRADVIVQDEVDSALLCCSGESQHGRAFFFLSLLFICAGLGGEGGWKVCVCVCGWVGERERERQIAREREKGKFGYRVVDSF